MPQPFDLGQLPDSPPAVKVITQDKFDRGVMTIVHPSKLPKNALAVADNLWLGEDGTPEVRPGVAWFGTAPSADAIDGSAWYVDSNDEVHLIVVAGGKIYRSLNDGTTWAECTGATLTAGKKVHFEQAASFLYIFNGHDNIARYDSSTTLATYTALTTPLGSSLTKGAGLAGTTVTTLRYRVSAVNDIGYTLASTALTIGVDRDRAAFDSTNYTEFQWGAVSGAIRYDIYVGTIAGEEKYLASVEGTETYQDRFNAIEQSAIQVPQSNTTQGPRVSDMSLIGSRLFATGDRDYPYRIWISGAGQYIGYFSSAYDATYIDWQKGGQLKPIKVEDYRDGKGSPLATAWCDSKDGLGAVLQGTVETFTVGSISFPVPNFYKLPGSRGTNAPDSVVNVLNDYMYYNSQAFFNLGSRAQFLNLLSTDESSANIRPSVKQIRQSASHKIAGHFEDAKVYMSVPVDSDSNNTTMIYDTERKAWLPRAFNIGFERFFKYTSTEDTRHTLCWKEGDSQLSQIANNIKGDYGQAFQTDLQTGLQHVNPRNRFEFMYAEEGEMEFSSPQGAIGIELSAFVREDGFKPVVERTMSPSTEKYSWTTHGWGGNKWTNTDQEIVSFSEPSTKRFFLIGEDINLYQWRLQTNSLQAKYQLRTLQVNGTASQAGKPQEWELFE